MQIVLASEPTTLGRFAMTGGFFLLLALCAGIVATFPEATDKFYKRGTKVSAWLCVIGLALLLICAFLAIWGVH